MPSAPISLPLSAEQAALLQQLSASLSPTQMAWLGGYLTGTAGLTAGQPGAAPAAAGPEVTILYATQTGNAHRVGKQLAAAAQAKGFKVDLKDCATYKVKQLKKQAFVFIIAATYGEGEPPDTAMEFHEFLMGDRAAKMPNTKFSVLSLGDSSYEFFCKIGEDFDTRLEALGAQRLVPRVDCDLDYDDLADQWVIDVMAQLAEFAAPAAATSATVPSFAGAAESEYDKRNPFPAELSQRVLLNGRGSDKETYHVELSLEDSGLRYQPGDSVGIIPSNADSVVDSLIETLGFDANHALGGKPLRDTLLHDYEITILTRASIEKYNKFAESDALAALADTKNRAGLQEYSYGREIVDLMADYPVGGLTPEDFVSTLRKLPPRLYSIASSQALVDEEVHLTSATVRFSSHGRDRMGVATTYMVDRVKVGETMPIYLHSNDNFRLPPDSDTPIIMVGPGTGIAPFRAFVQEREATDAGGKNWLFFGDQHFTTDFLYQTEWLQYLKDGILSRLDVAFSRDQAHKVYVQTRMAERSKELYGWLQEGAAFYVCGDESRMAPDVHEALLSVIEKEGAMSREAAEEYVKTMQREKRYQRDVY
ncbi:MAG: sulfite reductase (NADPH) flavoprotein alpha-component [Rhodothermales bacterium]|jgi:sulfite reductase (NADPH) flavoprotein alpha-component